MKIERPEGTVIVPVRGTRYVYKIAEKRYLKDKGYNVNKRICVGKMEDDLYMIPNAKFYQAFDICIDNGKRSAGEKAEIILEALS